MVLAQYELLMVSFSEKIVITLDPHPIITLELEGPDWFKELEIITLEPQEFSPLELLPYPYYIVSKTGGTHNIGL